METMEEEMPTEMTVKEAPPALKLTAAEIQANINLIQQVLKKVMKKGVHFDVVPGCGPKEVLLKPGAEYIMVLFRLSGEPQIEDLSNEDEIRYRIRVRVTHQITHNEVGWGVGEASSNETKYRWIKAEDSIWKATPEDRRREVTKTGEKGKPYTLKQVRANISDVANTVLKMAKKRALVDATLTCTAASDVFNQDIEDMDEGLRQNVAQPDRAPMPQRISDKKAADVAQQEYPDEDPNDSVEDPPAPAAPKDPRKAIDVKSARSTFAKFDAPCRVCNVKIPTEAKMLYVGDGNDKGRYHEACVRQA